MYHPHTLLKAISWSLAFLSLVCVHAERARRVESEQLCGPVREVHAVTKDETGLLISEQDMRFDKKGRLVEEESSWIEMEGTEIVYRRTKTEYEIDEEGWIVRTYSNYTSDGPLTERERWLSSESEYSMSEEGRIERTRLYTPESTTSSAEVSIRYDVTGRTTDSTYRTADGKETTMHRETDERGFTKLRTETTAEGIVSRFVYRRDTAGRTEEADIYTANASKPFMRTRTTYDMRGNVTSLSVKNLLLPNLPVSTTERDYDERGRIISERVRTPDAPASVTHYAYVLDSQGNPTATTSKRETESEPPLVLMTTYVISYY